MDTVRDRIRNRFLPALLTALGVTLVAAGLLSYTSPVAAGPDATDPPTIVTLAPTFVASSPSSTAAAAVPSPSPSFPVGRLATRVVVAALGIDLPVIKQPNASYPSCNVAMYLDTLGQPGEGRATYLYAHARTGMFLPILTDSKVNNGAAMLGMIVQVYTSDDYVFTYEITQVRRHQRTLDDALNATTEQLWLQTSEGPRAPPGVISPKVQVVAMPLSVESANPAEAHPVAHPITCG